MPTAALKVIDTAVAEVGYREGVSGGHPDNREKYAAQVPGLEWANGQPWCAVFVSWVALKAGVADLYPRTASCDVGGNWFKSRGQWSEYPAIGAQVFYGTPADLSHTGVVIAYDADTITTVEGNTNDDGSREGDGVYRKVRARRSANVVGYGHPKFPPVVPVKVTRVGQARALLTAALKKATGDRAAKIRAALRKLPLR